MSKREEKESKTPNGLPIAWHVTGSGKSSALTDIVRKLLSEST